MNMITYMNLRTLRINLEELLEDLPEHGLVPVGLVGPGHVLPGQPAADHRMVVVLHAPAAQPDVVEAGRVAGLHTHRVQQEFMLRSG